jgi:hypothetical protein
MKFSITVDIAATPERVWAVMSDIEHWSDWTPTVKSIKRLGNGPLAPGSLALVRQPRLPPALWRVTSLEHHSFSWRTGAPAAWVLARHWIEPTAAGSRATLSLDFTGWLAPLIGRLTRGLNDRYLKLEALGLKRRCESGEGEAP